MHHIKALSAISAGTDVGLMLDRRMPSVQRSIADALTISAFVQLPNSGGHIHGWLVRAKDGGPLPERVNSSGFGVQVRLMDKFYLPEGGDVGVTKVMFDLIADLYDELTTRSVNLAMARHLLKMVIDVSEVSPLILDFGCGTGIAIEALASCGGAPALLGVDISDPMLQRASARGETVLELDRWRNDLILVDGIIANFVLHFGISEDDLHHIARSLKPGGQFAANFFKGSQDDVDNLAALFARDGLALVSCTNFEATSAPNPVLVFKKIAHE